MSLLSDRQWLKRRAIQRCAAKNGLLTRSTSNASWAEV